MRIFHLALASLLALGLGLSAAPVHSATATPQQQVKKKAKLSKDRLTPFYKLSSDSSFVQGCFDPCLCPLQFSPDLRGSFELHLLPSLNPAFDLYEVTGVNWLVASGTAEIRITGSGTYRVGLGQQQLTLDLFLNDGTATVFDSGLVPGGSAGPLPRIDITVNVNDLVCFDTVLHIKASPQRQSTLRPFTIDSGTFQEGCLPPCLCPIAQAQPVSGNFRLMPLGQGPNGLFEFAVVDLHWAIHPPSPSPTPAFTPVTGQGFYQVALLSTTPTNGEHRMRLELDVGGTADYWDSGLVPGAAAFPVIDIALGINDFTCFERVFALQASPH